jgi:hypothetical protein
MSTNVVKELFDSCTVIDDGLAIEAHAVIHAKDTGREFKITGVSHVSSFDAVIRALQSMYSGHHDVVSEPVVMKEGRDEEDSK